MSARTPCCAGPPGPGEPVTARAPVPPSGFSRWPPRAGNPPVGSSPGTPPTWAGLAAAVTAVLDPGLIVLGGSTGSDPQLLPGVRAELGRLSWPTEVVSSQIGDLGTVVGAARLAVTKGVQNVTEGAQAKD